MRASGLDGLELTPADHDASVRFSRDGLGLRVVQHDAGEVIFALGGGPRLVLRRGTHDGRKPDYRGLAISLQVEDPDGLARLLKSRGLEPTTIIETSGWRRCSVTDPDGVTVQLQRPSPTR